MQHGTGAVGTPKTLAACADAIAAKNAPKPASLDKAQHSPWLCVRLIAQ